MNISRSSFIISILSILLLGVVGYIVISHSPKTTTLVETPKENTKPVGLIDTTLARNVTYTAPDQYTIFKVTYPQFTNASASFNAEIKDLVNAGIDEQKQDAGANWKARYDTQTKGENIPQFPAEEDKFYFDTSWKPVQENKNFISGILTISAFSGGAHGYETLTSFNYDVANKKDVELSDLFPNDPNYLQTISDFSRKDLETQFRKRLNVKTKEDEEAFISVLQMLNDGTSPDVDNFNVFTFSPTEITIYFNQYQVAPYSMGESTVVIPRS